MAVFVPPTSIDSLFAAGLYAVINNWVIWGIISFVFLAYALAKLKVDSWASGIILFVWLAVLGAPVLTGAVGGILGSNTVFTFLFGLGLIAIGFLVVIMVTSRVGAGGN